MGEYSHGAPFDPSALLNVWERCGINPTGQAACKPGRLRYARA
jgi:hypothetical protein